MRAATLAVVAVLTGCTEVQFSAIKNEPPTVLILSHEQGQAVLEAYTITVRGSVNDGRDPAEELTVSWYAGDDVACTDPAAPDGSTSCDMQVPTGDTFEVRLEARDLNRDVGVASVDLVIQPTDPPVVTLISPTAGDIYYSDIPVLFEGIITDAEDDATALEVLWDSDLDGPLDMLDTTVNALNEVRDEGQLSEGDHLITMTGVDSTGKTDAESVRVRVGPPNTAPTCSITGPDADSRYEEGEVVVFEAMVDDGHQGPDSLDVLWTSSLDGELNSDGPDPGGLVSFSLTFLSRGSHTITLTTTDELGAICTANIDVDVVGPPTVTISEPSPGTVAPSGAPVTFTAQVDDVEDAPDDLSLSWVSDVIGEFNVDPADGQGVATFTQVFVDTGPHNITLTVTDSDGSTDFATTQLIIDGAPSQPVIDVIPDPAPSDEDLTAVIVTPSVDPEGQPVSYRYTWYVDDVLDPTLLTDTVPAANTRKGEVWKARVYPSDGALEGPYGEDWTTVLNTPPSLDSVDIQPDPAYTQHDLSVDLIGWMDADGDPELVDYSWEINGQFAGDQALLGNQLTERGNTVTVTVTPRDDESTGVPVQDSTVIQNSPPTADSAVIGPDPAYTDSVLYVTVIGWNDYDNDPPGYQYVWYVEGNVVPGENGNQLAGVFFDRGEDVWVEVTPWDGADVGPTITAPFITIQNSPPSVSNAVIQPQSPADDDVLTALAYGWADADNDPPNYEYQWYIDDVAVPVGGDLPSLDSALTNPLDVIYVEVTPYDGLDRGTPVTSGDVIIANGSPSAPVVHIEPANPESNDDLVCIIDQPAIDPEGDYLTYNFYWFRDTVPFDMAVDENYIDDKVLSVFTTPLQEWECHVRAFDGFSEGPPGIDTVTISEPRVAVLALGDTHACLVDTADEMACWGNGNSGRLSLDGGTYIDVDTGGGHTCALTPNGGAVCAGVNVQGQAPAGIPGTYTKIATGDNHSCGIRSDNGQPRCWGANNNGSLDVSGLTGFYDRISMGHHFACVIGAYDDNIECWGDDAFGKATPPPGIDFDQISTGYNHTCGVDPSGTGHCWGNDDFNKTVPPGGTWVMMAAGRHHTCGIRPDTTIACWGKGTGGGGVNEAVPGLYTHVDAGEDFTCAAPTSGGVICWGLDGNGQASPPVQWW